MMSINSTEWQNRYEVFDRFNRIAPQHMLHRRQAGYSSHQTMGRVLINLLGVTVRYSIKAGLMERSIPVINDKGRGGRNVGNYSLRLTAIGMERRKQLYRYFCNNCFDFEIIRVTGKDHPRCRHCRSMKLTLSPA